MMRVVWTLILVGMFVMGLVSELLVHAEPQGILGIDIDSPNVPNVVPGLAVPQTGTIMQSLTSMLSYAITFQDEALRAATIDFASKAQSEMVQIHSVSQITPDTLSRIQSLIPLGKQLDTSLRSCKCEQRSDSSTRDRVALFLKITLRSLAEVVSEQNQKNLLSNK